jgi:NAD(P)-dependent dehydrogenase (short-subunit alcohol dehydrogenase family)
MKIEGGVAVVTGAASGIGRATAIALGREGCDVAIVDLDEAGLASCAKEIEALGRKVSSHLVDVSQREAMAALPDAVLAAHGRVSILVNNAGVALSGSIEEQSIEDLEWIVGINFWGVIYGTQFFLPHLRAAGEAHIVNLSSLFGLIGLPGQGAYCATKAAVRSLSETLFSELRGSGIGVTSVHPGGIATNIIQNARNIEGEDKVAAADFFERHGMPPGKAAQKIVSAIRHDRSRLRICRETYLTDWIKRLLPVTTNRIVSWGWARGQAQREQAG